MSSFFRSNSANRHKITTISIAAVAMLLLGFGLLSFPRQAADQSSVESLPQPVPAVDLGITYLHITPGLSAYYNLGVSSGVMITEVVSGSPAARTGIQVGDVILSYNGVKLEGKARLLGIMMASPAGNKVKLEVWRENNLKRLEMFHPQK